MRMFRRNLFKHFLPVALSVAMTVQSVPVTSYAAETETIETETAVAEESEEASAEQVGNDGEEAKPEETKGEEENKTSEETTTEEVKTEETKTEETKSEEEKIEAQAEEEIENNKAEELPKSEIVFDESKLEDVGGYHYSDGSYKGEYQPKVDTAKSNADDIVKAVKKATYAVIYSDADENDERYDLPFQYQWQKKGAEDKWEDIVYPQDAGEYRIKVSLAEQANLCEAAADAFVNFTIEKAKFTITPNAYNVESGITVAEVKTKIADNYEIGNDISKAAAVKECKVEIKTATGTETLADDVTIEKNESYVVVYTFTLTDDFAKNYELSDPADYTFNISQTVKFATITVEYNKQDEAVGKKYDGKAIDIKNDIVPAIKTLKVTVPNSDRDDNGLVLIEGTDNIDKLNPTWGTKAEGEFVALDSAPTDAGDYYLRLEYKNENGTYGSATEYIRVVITPVDIAIVPEVSQTEWNDGDKVSDIIKKVTYKVYDVADGKRAESARTDIDEYFWGDAYGVELAEYYNDAGDAFTVGVGEQYFKPLFVVERGVTKDGVTTWTALKPNDTIQDSDLVAADASVKYRVAYSGKLCVYDTDEKGEPIIRVTNSDVNNVQGNYKVDLTEAAKDADSKALTIEESQAVKIDVSALLGKDKAGESYDNAIVSTYTGDSIFKSKSDYKKAAIVGADGKAISSDAEKDFTYTWQYAYLNDDKEDGRFWSYCNDVEDHSAPYNFGNYRLEITYTDKTNANRAKEKAYVYYTILPQDAIAVIKGAPEAYVDGKTTIGDYLDSLTSETDFTLYSYNKDTKAKGDEIKLNVEEKAALRNNFTVKMKAVDGEKTGKYVECDEFDQFIPGREYVLDMYAGHRNYNFGYDLDKHGDYKSYDTIWDNETCAITVKQSKGIEVKIDVDYTKITDRSKNYDGKNFDLTEIKKAVRFVNAKTGEDLTEALKDKVKYYFVLENDGNGHVAPIKTYDRYYDGNDAYLVSKNEIVAEDAPVIHGGTYDLVWSLEADENYAAVVPVNADGSCNHNSCITDITINKRELTITPVLNGEIKAGTHTNNIVTKTGSNNYTDQYQLENPTISGFVDDKEAENAFDKFTVSVHEDTKPDDKYAGILKSDTKYYLIENAQMKPGLSWYGEWCYSTTEPTYYERDYSPVSERIAFTPVRAEASVTSVTRNEAENLVKAIDTISGSAKDGYIHTITTRSAIPYDSTGVTIGDKLVKGNNYTIQITAPKEFDNIDSVVYETAIAKAGGIATRNGLVITATFNANNTQTAEFDIVWKPGYKETFKLDFTKAQLVNDFTKAVAPKSLAFNNVNKKMAVGETQQLDVKITKKQMSDIILLGYSVDNGDVLQVSDSGYVTALSKGTATVSVFPCFKDANDGNKVKPIEGAKAVTVKIAVADVATPKISKITAYGSWAEVKYAEVANGYRREVYVLEGKNLKATDFESKIADAVKGNGDYSAFDYVKLGAEEITDKKVTTVEVSGLQSNKEYTVYVRNVAALRELKNGAKVATSYAGAVKGFKTTAAENNGLRVYFDFDAKNNKVYCDDTDDRCYANHTDVEHHEYTVKLTDKKATVSVDASYLQGLSYSDKDDFIWRTLPLSKDDQKSYLNPKLEYYAMSVSGYDYDSLMDDVKHDWGKSSLATVDKKGNVTLKGAGDVYIYAVDPATEHVGEVRLNIVAEADSVTGKNVTLTEGQYIYLHNYLTYKQGSMAIAGYNGYELSVDQSSNEYFKIEKIDAYNYDDDDDGIYDDYQYPYYGTVDYKITALKAGGKLTLTVTDKTVAANGGKPATVKLTSKAIAPVKALKAKNVTDTNFRITFTDSASSNARYRVDVTDERGKVVKSEIVSTDWWYSSTGLIDNPEYKEYFEVGYDVNSDSWESNLAYYDAKANTYTYSYYVSDNSINLLSTYNVTVTALYDKNGTDTYVESKAAKTKVKTTNIPASRKRLLKADTNTGEGISINTKDYRDKYGYNYRDLYNPGGVSYNRLRSGNKYTLSILDADNPARARKTDTLTWKSTDSKVATVKANPGSFTATLKAVKPGKTTIEVTSKITKSVISRYDVYVVASGDAGQYFGDNEPYDTTREFTDQFNLTDAINEGSVIELDADVKKTVRVDANTRQWFSFTAPQYGGYSFDASAIDTNQVEKLYYDDDTKKDIKVGTSINIEKGTKVYFYVDNNSYTSENVYAQVSEVYKYSELALGDNAVAKNGKYIFIAPTADHYTFTYVKTVTDKDGKEKDEVVGTPDQVNLGKGGKVYKYQTSLPAEATKIVITTRTTAEAPKAGATTDVTFDKTGIWQYFKFTAEEDGLYTFDVEDIAEGADVSIDIEESLSDTNYDVINNGATSSQNIDTAVELKKGEVRYLGIKATQLAPNSKNEYTEKFTCKLKVTKVDSVVIGTDKTVSVVKNTTSYVSYQYPENGKYRFTVTTSTEGLTSAPTIMIGGTSGNVREVTDAKKNDIVKIEIRNNDAAKDATFTVKVEKLVTDVLAVDKDNKVSLVKGVGKTVEFPVTKSGIYTISAKDSNGGSVLFSGAETAYYQAGSTIKFILKDTFKTEEVTVKVTEQPINTLSDGEISFSKDGETKYFKFTAKKEGRYSIKLDKTAATNTTVYKPATINAIVSGIASWTDIDTFMSAGETVYVRMASTANAVGDKVKVTITSDTAEAVGDGVTVAKQTAEGVVTTKYVSFVAPKKARYQVSFGSNVSVYYDNGIDGKYVYRYPAEGMVLNAGRKIYFEVTNYSTTDDYTFKVSEVEAKKVGESVSLKAGQGAWFVLTTEAKAADTLYNFEATAENEAKDASATITRKVNYDLANGYAVMETTMVVVPGNASVYYYVTTNKDASVKLTATASATDELTKAEGHEFDGQVTKTFTTTAPEDGFYKINAKIGDNTTYDFSVDKVTNGIKSEDGTYIIRLKKGDKIAVQITSELSGKNTFKFTLDKLTEITTAGKDITLKSGVGQTVVFVPTEATTYMITKSYSSDKVTNPESFGPEVASFYKVSDEYNLVWLKAYTSDNSDVTVNVKATPVVPTALTVDGDAKTISEADAKKGTPVYYSVDVEKDKTYAIKVSNASVKYDYSIEEIEWEYPYTNVNFKAPRGGKLYIKVTPNGDKEVSVKVISKAAEEITVDTAKTIDISKVQPGEYVYYSFTVPEDGEYTASLAKDKDEAPTSLSSNIAVVKKVGGNSIGSSGTYSKTDNYFKGNKVIYRVYYSNTDLTKNLTFKVTKTPTKAITTVNEDVTVNVPANGSIKLTYVAAVGENPTMAISDAVDNVHLGSRYTTNTNATNPTTYYWTLSNGNDAAKDVKVKITVDKTDATLKLGDNDVTFDTTKETPETRKVVAFTAEKAGEYKITKLDKDGKDVTVEDSLILAKGQKYVRTVDSDAEVNEGKKIVVKVSLVQEATELELGKQFRGTGVSTLYVFTATTGGEYAVVDEEGKTIAGSSKTLAAGESYMFTGEISTSRLVSLERTDNK